MNENDYNEALHIIDDIRKRFSDREQKYLDFLLLFYGIYGDANVISLKDQKSAELYASLIQQLRIALKEDDDLLQRIIQFLNPSEKPRSPDTSRVDLKHDNSNDLSGIQNPTNYIKTIRQRFPVDKSDTSYRFDTIIRDYYDGKKELNSMLFDIVNLFRGHNDLIQKFLTYIPKESQQSAILYVNKLLQIPPSVESSYIPTFYPVVDAPIPPVSTIEPPIPVEQTATVVPTILFPPGPQVPQPEDSSIPMAEQHFFNQIRQCISSDDIYLQFLKLLDLYNRDIFSLSDLFIAMTDLLYIRHPAISLLRNYLAQKGINEDEVVYPQAPLSWEQLHACKGPTPSYHELPPQVPRCVGSQRSFADSLVLNDDLVSQAIGSEDLSYFHMRRNPYEEALFRCEDDRFEVDVILETTRSAITQLQALQEELETLQEEKQGSYRLQEGALSAVQLAAIRRVYAQNGMDQEVMKLLFLNPRDCIPRIIERLKEKEKEWMNEKVIMNERCCEIQKQNYYLSLDHHSFYFRQNDRKNSSAKVLIDTIKEVAVQQANCRSGREKINQDGVESSEEKEWDHKDSNAISNDQENGRLDGGEAHLQFAFSNPAVHKQVIRLLLEAGKRKLSYSNMKRFRLLLQDLVISFFQLTPNFIDSAEIENSGVQYAVGTAVSTPKGPGVIASFDSVSKLYTVTFPDGESQFPRGEILVQPKNDTDSESEESDSQGREPSMSIKRNPIHKTETNQHHQIESNEPPLPSSLNLLYGTNSLYVFYRLYALLYERLNNIASLCEDALSTEERMTHQPNEKFMLPSNERQMGVMDMLIQLIRGEVENARFEQRCRELLGANGYVFSTMDRVAMGCVRQLQAVMNDTVALQLIALRKFEKQRGEQRRSVGERNAVRMVGDVRVNVFRMEFDSDSGMLKFWYVGMAHDLLRREGVMGMMDNELNQYAEDYVRCVEKESENEVSQRKREREEENEDDLVVSKKTKEYNCLLNKQSATFVRSFLEVHPQHSRYWDCL